MPGPVSSMLTNTPPDSVPVQTVIRPWSALVLVFDRVAGVEEQVDQDLHEAVGARLYRRHLAQVPFDVGLAQRIRHHRQRCGRDVLQVDLLDHLVLGRQHPQILREPADALQGDGHLPDLIEHRIDLVGGGDLAKAPNPLLDPVDGEDQEGQGVVDLVGKARRHRAQRRESVAPQHLRLVVGLDSLLLGFQLFGLQPSLQIERNAEPIVHIPHPPDHRRHRQQRRVPNHQIADPRLHADPPQEPQVDRGSGQPGHNTAGESVLVSHNRRRDHRRDGEGVPDRSGKCRYKQKICNNGTDDQPHTTSFHGSVAFPFA